MGKPQSSGCCSPSSIPLRITYHFSFCPPSRTLSYTDVSNLLQQTHLFLHGQPNTIFCLSSSLYWCTSLSLLNFSPIGSPLRITLPMHLIMFTSACSSLLTQSSVYQETLYLSHVKSPIYLLLYTGACFLYHCFPPLALSSDSPQHTLQVILISLLMTTIHTTATSVHPVATQYTGWSYHLH